MDVLIPIMAVLALVLLSALAYRFGVDSRPSITSTQRNWW